MKNPISFYYPFESFLFYPPLEINRPIFLQGTKATRKGGRKKREKKLAKKNKFGKMKKKKIEWHVIVIAPFFSHEREQQRRRH